MHNYFFARLSRRAAKIILLLTLIGNASFAMDFSLGCDETLNLDSSCTPKRPRFDDGNNCPAAKRAKYDLPEQAEQINWVEEIGSTASLTEADSQEEEFEYSDDSIDDVTAIYSFTHIDPRSLLKHGFTTIVSFDLDFTVVKPDELYIEFAPPIDSSKEALENFLETIPRNLREDFSDYLKNKINGCCCGEGLEEVLMEPEICSFIDALVEKGAIVTANTARNRSMVARTVASLKKLRVDFKKSFGIPHDKALIADDGYTTDFSNGNHMKTAQGFEDGINFTGSRISKVYTISRIIDLARKMHKIDGPINFIHIDDSKKEIREINQKTNWPLDVDVYTIFYYREDSLISDFAAKPELEQIQLFTESLKRLFEKFQKLRPPQPAETFSPDLFSSLLCSDEHMLLPDAP